MERTMAVADPSRWRIVRLLGDRTRTVTQLAEATGLSVAATCRHVQRLRAVGLVQANRKGKELLCRPAGPETAVGRWLEDLLKGGTPYRRLASAPRPSRGTRAPAAEPKPPPKPPSRPGSYRDIEDFLL